MALPIVVIVGDEDGVWTLRIYVVGRLNQRVADCADVLHRRVANDVVEELDTRMRLIGDCVGVLGAFLGSFGGDVFRVGDVVDGKYVDGVLGLLGVGDYVKAVGNEGAVEVVDSEPLGLEGLAPWILSASV